MTCTRLFAHAWTLAAETIRCDPNTGERKTTSSPSSEIREKR